MTDAETPAPKEKTSYGIDKGYSRAFTTSPKIRRHLTGSMPTRKRAAYLMELLFQNDFIKEAPYEAIYRFVVEKADFIGLQERTVTQYIGRPRKTLRQNENLRTSLRITYPRTGTVIPKEYSAVKRLPEKEGICQKLGYMKFDYARKVPFLILYHERVPLPYHLKQALLNPEKSEGLECSKEDLRVLPIGSPKKRREASIETVVIESREKRERL